jgi:hypothetical protein
MKILGHNFELTPWISVLLEKLRVALLVKNFSPFHNSDVHCSALQESTAVHPCASGESKKPVHSYSILIIAVFQTVGMF